MKNFLSSDLVKVLTMSTYFLIVAFIPIPDTIRNVMFVLGCAILISLFAIGSKEEPTEQVIRIPSEDIKEALVINSLVEAQKKAEAANNKPENKNNNNQKPRTNNNNNNNKKPQKVMKGNNPKTSNGKHPNQYTKVNK